MRQYQRPSTSAGEASVFSPRRLACSSLNSGPFSRTNVSPWSLVKNTLPLTPTGDAEKPSRQIYERALVMSQAEPSAAAFIDDREHNLETARELGMHTILYHDAPQLRRDLTALAVAI